MFSCVSINELRILFRVSIKLNPILFFCEDHEDWFPVHYLAVDCSYFIFCSGVGFDQVSGVAVIVSLLFAGF